LSNLLTNITKCVAYHSVVGPASAGAALEGSKNVKITDLRIIVHERTMPAGTGRPTMPLGVMTIATDEGVDGHAFVAAPGPDVTGQLVSTVKPMLLGRNPLDLGAVWHDLAALSRL